METLRPYYVTRFGSRSLRAGPLDYAESEMPALLFTRRQALLAWPPFLSASPKKATLAGIEFQILQNGFHSRRRYLLIHGNEATARECLAGHMRVYRGIAHLVTGAERYVEVAGGKLDPNRMFSREGALRSFRRLNPTWSDAALASACDWLDQRRGKLLKHLLPPRQGLLFAVHNNSQGYSMEEEIPISNDVHLPLKNQPHEFFLAADRIDFLRLAGGPYNVLLQDSPKGPDDGSLSRLAAKHRFRYVNLEVGLGKAEKQSEMMAWLEQRLP